MERRNEITIIIKNNGTQLDKLLTITEVFVIYN
jgi:hypothetical protein